MHKLCRWVFEIMLVASIFTRQIGLLRRSHAITIWIPFPELINELGVYQSYAIQLISKCNPSRWRERERGGESVCVREKKQHSMLTQLIVRATFSVTQIEQKYAAFTNWVEHYADARTIQFSVCLDLAAQ